MKRNGPAGSPAKVYWAFDIQSRHGGAMLPRVIIPVQDNEFGTLPYRTKKNLRISRLHDFDV